MSLDGSKLGDLLPKAKQVGTGIAAGGSTLFLMMQMFGARLDELNKKIDDKNKEIREYVNFKSDQTVREMTYLREGQVEIKDLLRMIESRLYKQTEQRKK